MRLLHIPNNHKNPAGLWRAQPVGLNFIPVKYSCHLFAACL